MAHFPISFTTGSFWPVMTREAVDSLLSSGIQDIELTLQMFEYYINGEGKLIAPVIPYIQDLVNESRLRVWSIHAPHLFLEFTFSDRMRLAMLNALLETAKSLRAKVIVVHPFHLFHHYQTTLKYMVGVIPVDQALLPGLEEFCNRCLSEGIHLGMENIGLWPEPQDHLFNDPRFLREFLSEARRFGLKLTLDLQHACFDQQLDEFLQILPDYIVNVHAADVTEQSKRVQPGKGILDWKRLMREFNDMESLQAVTVETYEASQATVNAASQFLEHQSDNTLPVER